MMRKIIIVLAFALLFGMAAGGCGAGGGEEKEEKKQKEEQKEELSMGGLGYYFAESYEPSEFVQADVDSDTVQWICSAYAIYTEYNRKDLGCVGGASEDNRDIYQQAIKIGLADGWGISDRESAIGQVNKLLEGGHRAKYREFISEMEKHDLLSLDEEELLNRVKRENGDAGEFQAAYRAYHAMGEKAVDAWDYSRALQVLGDCYQAEYINLEECMDQSLAVAEKLQEEFESWDEVCESYLYGFQFWKKEDADYHLSETADRREVYNELKEMEEGPFAIPYDTKLQESWKNVEIKKEEEPEEQKTEKGVYSLSDLSDAIRVEVKAPEGFETDFEPDGHMIYLERFDTKRDAVSTLVYDIYENASEDDILYGIRMNLAMSEQNGAENIVMGEIQMLEAAGQKINYVVSAYKRNDGSGVRRCDSWIVLDDTYKLSCVAQDEDSGNGFLYPEIEELLEEIYGKIQRKE